MNAKQRAVEIYGQHIEIAKTDGRLFRKTVMDQLMAETNCSLAAAATHYNNAKKGATPIEGLGRAPLPPGMRKMGNAKTKTGEELIPDEECFTVIELLQESGSEVVGRCQSFILQGDASEKFDQKSEFWPNGVWVMIKGLGPNTGDTYKLDAGEKEIKRYAPIKESEPA